MVATVALPVPATGFQPDECSAEALRPPRLPSFETPLEYAAPWSFVSFDRRRGGIYTREDFRRATWVAEDFGTVGEDPTAKSAYLVHESGFVVGVVRPATRREVESWRSDAEAAR